MRRGLHLVISTVIVTAFSAVPLVLAEEKEGVIRVGVYDFRPIVCDGGEAGGDNAKAIFNVLLDDIAVREGWTLELVPGTLQQGFERLDMGSVDLLAAATYARQHEDSFQFTRETVLSTWAQMYTHTKSDIKSLLDLSERKIGVVRDDPYNPAIRKMIGSLNIEVSFVEFKSNSELLRGLERQWIDVAFVDRIFGFLHEREFQIRSIPVILSPVELRFAISKSGNRGMIDVLDYHLKAMKDDPASSYRKAIQDAFVISEPFRMPTSLKCGLAAGLGLVLFLGLAAVILRHQVARQTRELSVKNAELKAENALRVEAVKSLEESEARFRALHNASFGGIAIHDRGHILECNQGLSEITGYAYDELIGMDGLALISDAMRNKVLHNIDAGYEKPYEAEGVRKDGGIYPLRLEARKILYRGKAARVVEFRDISDIKQAEKEMEAVNSQLTQAQKMESVGRLAGGVAHDFNNMLMGVMGYADLCREHIGIDHPACEWLDEITHGGERAANLTRQLLAFARKQTVAPKLLDINDAIRDMLKLLRRLIGEDIDLAWLPGANLWTVKIDPSQVDQILANLCVNARDAIGSSAGRVTIETHNATLDAGYCADHLEAGPGDYVMLTVSDDGCGMDCKTLDKIFEPFFTTKGVGEGTGLGLSTVYGIIKQNNGFVNVYSEPGKGTTFRVYLPRVVEELTEQAHDRQADVKPQGGTETVMLVEDEKSVRFTLNRFLKGLGYTVLDADSPEVALSLAAEHAHSIDLLLTDVVMPGMSGRELAERLAPDFTGMKVLYMSGYTADFIAHRGVLDDGVNFLSKPVSFDTLARKVRALLDCQQGC